MERYSVAPLVAVGFEGLFGAISILIAMPFLGLFKDRSMFFDLPRGWHQMIDTPTVLWSGIAIAISISLFNFFGLSVTRHGMLSIRQLRYCFFDQSLRLRLYRMDLSFGDSPLAY